MRRSTSDKRYLTVPAVAGIKTSERSRSLPLSFNIPLAKSPVSSPGSDRSVGTAPDTPVISIVYTPRSYLGETDPSVGECTCDCKKTKFIYFFC